MTMKLSEAIRVGSKIVPEGRMFAEECGGGYCALGSALISTGVWEVGNDNHKVFNPLILIQEEFSEYPWDDLYKWSKIHSLGFFSGYHKYSREDIADLVEEWEKANLDKETVVVEEEKVLV